MGARASQIRRLVLVDGIKVAAVGLTLGAGLAWLLSRALVTLAFGVTAGSPMLWAATVAAIGGATLLAAWRPAAAAMRVDPLILLADE